MASVKEPARVRFAKAVLSFLFCSLLIVGIPCFADSKDMLAFEPGDSIEEIRRKIEHNGYSFTVDNHWVYDMDPETKGRFFSRHAPLVPRPYSRSDGIGPLANQLEDALPSAFDWRDHNGHSYIGSVRDQGSCGSCYAFSACAAAEGTYNVAMGLYGANGVDFSEAFLAFCLSDQYSGFDGCDGSTYDYEELDALVSYGVCKESDYPYTDVEQACPLSGQPSAIPFESWHRIPCGDINAIKTAIMTYGVVDAAVHAGTAFQAYSGGVYEDTNRSCDATPCYYKPTNHVIALVGWDDNPPEGGGGCWILRNSWGTGWGEEGYMRIRYDAARVACEACYLVSPPCTPGNPTMCIVTPEEGFSSIVGQRTKVSISVKDCGPVTGATLLLTPTNGDTPLNLLDNGVSPDETANDGTYSANWNPQHAGSVTLHIVASGFGATLTGSISGDVGEAPRGGVLIAVDIAGSAGYWNPSPTYEDAITSAGYHVVETITASSEGDIPWPSPFTEAEYDAVVVLTGENWRAGPDNISPEDETALTHYLNTGGCLLIVGQDLLWGAHPSWGNASGFFRGYMGVGSVSQDTLRGVPSTNASGAAGSILEGTSFTVKGHSSGGPFYLNDLWIDTFTPVTDAHALIEASGANPCAIYYTNGLFKTAFSTIELGATDAESFRAIIEAIMDWFIPSLKAGFRARYTRGVAPLTVDFVDESKGEIHAWYWVFGDGATSTLRNPAHIYNDAGAYTVSLTVTGPDGEDTEAKEDYVILHLKNIRSWLLLLLGDGRF
jgi:C1A family cysteine protease